MKANPDRGGGVDDIHLDTVTMYTISSAVVFGTTTYNDIATGEFSPNDPRSRWGAFVAAPMGSRHRSRLTE